MTRRQTPITSPLHPAEAGPLVRPGSGLGEAIAQVVRSAFADADVARVIAQHFQLDDCELDEGFDGIECNCGVQFPMIEPWIETWEDGAKYPHLGPNPAYEAAMYERHARHVADEVQKAVIAQIIPETQAVVDGQDGW